MLSGIKAAPVAGLVWCCALSMAAAPAYSQVASAAVQTTAAATPATTLPVTPATTGSTTAQTTAAATSDAATSSNGTAEAAGQLAEVTVTAQRRTETEVNVPMSMSVLSQQTLQTEEVKTFNDFATQVPNLSFNYGGSPGGTGTIGGNTDDRAVAIRGIQGGDTTGYYLDDLPLPLSVTPRVLDLSRIEVLEGPQGTLYGARSMGGTIRMITNAPDLNHFSGFVLGQGTTIDAGGNGYEFYGIFNVPLVTDTLALRITPFKGQDGGFINRKWSETPRVHR